MAGAAGARLATAVRAAGGLGLVGVGHGAGGEYIEREVGGAARAAGEPGTGTGSWGAGFMSWSLALDDHAALRSALKFEPPVVALSAGDPTAAARLAARAGALVAVQVGTVAEVKAAAEQSDVSLLVVRGAEGGGHGLNELSTLPLLQYAVGVTDKPVAAAGGIASAAGVAAVLAAGAVAAWIGTRFVPCVESLTPPGLKEAIAAATGDDTVYSSVFDAALGIPWPREYGGRALANEISAAWGGRVEALREAARGQAAGQASPLAQAPGGRAGASRPGADAAREAVERVRRGRAEGDPATAPVYAGQAAGLVPIDAAAHTAAEIVAELAGFREHLRRAARAW